MSRLQSAGLVASLSRFVLNVRLVAVLFTVVWMQVVGKPTLALGAALIVAALLTLVALLRWHQVASALMRHPAFLAADLVLALGILVIVGPESPFFYFTVGTAVLAGVLYGWVGAVFFTVLLLAGYLWIVSLRAPMLDLPLTFQTLVGLPLLYPFAAAGGAGVRGLVDRLLETEQELAQHLRRTAVVDERARFAREMHDSLAKTLHGMAFSARAIAMWAGRSPERAAADATKLASIAEQAAVDAREMIGDLRADQLDAPLAAVVTEVAQRWGQENGVTVDVAAEATPEVSPEGRYELLCILKEALRNTEQHADADAVAVHLHAEGSVVVLRVNDDGAGMPAPPDLEALAAEGHYGLLGMSERAGRVGGSVIFCEGSLPGLCVEARVPQEAAYSPPVPQRPATPKAIA